MKYILPGLPQVRRAATAAIKIFLGLCILLSFEFAAAQSPSPNVLLIIVDDLNDWVGVMGGHPQARTPRIDALAAQGTLFTNAHAAAPVCHPSRTSLMTGISPGRSGIKNNTDFPVWRKILPNAVTLNQAFRDAGYYTAGYGKIFHAGTRNQDTSNWDVYVPKPTSAKPPANLLPLNGLPELTRGDNLGGGDWGILDEPDAEFEDHKVATWAEDFIANRDPVDPKPFFLSVGLRSTHSPWYYPPAYYDLIAGGVTSKIRLPPTISDDLDDVGPTAVQWATPAYWLPLTGDPWKIREGIHGYLAGGAFLDAQVGRILDALDSSAFANDTIVVLLSDHGYHFGEKNTWQKEMLWEEDTSVPMIFRIPPSLISTSVVQVDEPTNISAIYPTLLDLAGIPLPAYPEGDPLYRVDYRSLVPLLDASREANWSGPSVTYGAGDDVSIRTANYRFTLYRDFFVELYDKSTDVNEWVNIADSPQLQDQVAIWTSDALRYLSGEHAPFGYQESCGPPPYNPAVDFAIHIWKDCEGPAPESWRLRVTAGGDPSIHTFIGDLTSDLGFSDITAVEVEGADVFDNSIHFEFQVKNNGQDGINFTFPTGANVCLDLTTLPAGANVFVGETRFPVALPFYLESLQSCLPIGTGRIGDYVWADADIDGVQDASEDGFAGVDVELLNCNNNVLKSTTTDSNGHYLFKNLSPGNYKVRFIPPTGIGFSPRYVGGGGKDSNADPSTGMSSCQSLSYLESRMGIDAGLVTPTEGQARIGDYVWADTNGDGIQAANESGVAGIDIRLLDCNDQELASTTTDGSGKYNFENLHVGSYKIRFVAPTGTAFSPSNMSSGDADSNANPVTGITSCFSMAYAQSRVGIDAGLLMQPAGGQGQIGDYVWADTDGDGIQDSNETGLGGVDVRLLDCNNMELASTTSDGSGNFLFANLGVNGYRVRFIAPVGFAFSPQYTSSTGGSDSDANVLTGVSGCRSTADGQIRLGIDAGFVLTN